MELVLRGKVAAVTGGSEGIGRATVLRLVAEGAKVAMCARGAEVLNAFAEELRKGGAKIELSRRQAQEFREKMSL